MNFFLVLKFCSSLLLSLDEIAAKVILEENEKYQSITSSLAVAVVKKNQKGCIASQMRCFLKDLF